MNSRPRISVLVSSYNNARFVAKKLREIENQTIFAQCEFLFIETASPERERDSFASFCKTHSNCRLLATEQRLGLYAAWNMGWNEARAALVCYSNMDDAMHPRLLETVVETMEKEQWDACSVLIAKQLDSDPCLNDWSVDHLRRLPLGIRPGPFTAWRTELRERIGMFDENFIGAGDLDLWSRLAANRLRVGLISKILYLYTKSVGQLSKTNGERLRKDRALLDSKPYPITWGGVRRRIFWLRYLVPIFPGLFCLPVSGGVEAHLESHAA